MTYIYIPEGRIGRIDLDNRSGHVLKLCTDNFTSCNIFVGISKDQKKYCLAHCDSSVLAETLRAQMLWIGKNGQFFILHNITFPVMKVLEDCCKDEKLCEARKATIIKIIPDAKDQIEGVKVGFGDAKPSNYILPREMHALEDTDSHPYAVLLWAKHSIEAQALAALSREEEVVWKSSLEGSTKIFQEHLKKAKDLGASNILPIYDCTQWEPCTNIKLSRCAEEYLKLMDVSKDSLPHQIYDALETVPRIDDVPQAEESTKQFKISTRAAFIYSYCRLLKDQELNPLSFLSVGYSGVEEDAAADIHKWIEKFKIARSSIELVDLLNNFLRSHEGRNSDVFVDVANTTIVLVYAYYFLFEKFGSAPQTLYQKERSNILGELLASNGWRRIDKSSTLSEFTVSILAGGFARYRIAKKLEDHKLEEGRDFAFAEAIQEDGLIVDKLHFLR